ncbi:MAG: hypothetical protein IJY25_04345 [Bacilli bacterium]|nr:hypothetical protein [Bacilli bacterium]
MNKKFILVLIIIVILGICLGLGIMKIFKTQNSQKVKNNEYIIVTDYKYKTMLNDGGSHHNIYYEISGNVVKKYEDYYIGFKGYEYQGKLIYEKEISNKIKKELISLIEQLLLKEDLNETNNYSPFVIKSLDQEKNIFNEESIKSLKEILKKIDSF